MRTSKPRPDSRADAPVAGCSDLTRDAQMRQAAQDFDSRLHAALAPWSAGLSPVSLALAWMDWALHLATQPAQAARLAARAQQAALGWWGQSLGHCPPAAADSRFADPAWRAWPWAPVVHAHHAAEDWWADASHLRGMNAHHAEITRFFARQWLDMLSPSNLPWANPQVMRVTRERHGANLIEGAVLAMDDWRRHHGLPPLRTAAARYVPGRDVAITPGRVVHRNHLTELIQYEPQTARVQAEPVFIVPSWIMKYYILDLSPRNSLVRWLVGQGHTVFILSWRNPDEGDAHLDMGDYLAQGVFDNLAAIARLLPNQAVQACGYCLGGTLLSIGAAAIARRDHIARADEMPEIRSVTLLAAETDFSEPGEMGVLIDEAQVAMLEDMMAERGFLTGEQMAGSFTYLHSRDLVWSRRLRELWLGQSNDPNDLMAWNADVTRMPAAMHGEYLRRCYLRNELAEGRFPVEGRPVALTDLRQPMFVVGTERDHVSPWKSVYKIHRLTHAPMSFVLTSGGHNAGIVSEPGHANRHYAIASRDADSVWLDPEQWQAQAARFEGSWWPAWHEWLLRQGSGKTVKARRPARVQGLPEAPGDHVRVHHDDVRAGG